MDWTCNGGSSGGCIVLHVYAHFVIRFLPKQCKTANSEVMDIETAHRFFGGEDGLKAPWVF